MDSQRRIRSEVCFSKPFAFVLRGERFIIQPPASLLMFHATETVEDEYRPGWDDKTVHVPERGRWALSVGGRVVAVARPSGRSRIEQADGDEWTVRLADDVTRTRRDWRKRLTCAAP